MDVALRRLFYDRFFSMIRRRRTLDIQYSIENIQLFEDSKNIPIWFFTIKYTKIISEVKGNPFGEKTIGAVYFSSVESGADRIGLCKK